MANPPPREAIMQALYDRLRTSVKNLGFTSRAFLSFDDIPQSEQPALLVVEYKGGAIRNANPGLPPVWSQHAMVILLVRDSAPSRNQTVETALHAMIGQVETALARQSNESSSLPDSYGTTLGGVVMRCWVTDYEIHHGAGAGQAAASVTVEMLAVP